jgi:hypothetical protein
MAGYTGVDTTNPLDGVAASVRLNASGTLGTTAITTIGASAMVVAAYAGLASGNTWSAESCATTGSLTERFDAANSTFISLAIADKVQASAGTTGVSTATMSTAGVNGGLLICLRPQLAAYVGSGSISITGAAGTGWLLPGSQTATLVQGALTFVSSGTTCVCTLPATPFVGDLIAVGVNFWDGSATAPTLAIADSNGNNYSMTPNSLPTGVGAADGFPAIFYLIAPSNASATITCTASRSISGGEFSIRVDEFSANGATFAFDLDAAATPTSGTPVTTPSLTPSQVGSLLYGICTPNFTISSVNSPWTVAESGQDAAGCIDAFILSSASGSTAMNMTQTSGAAGYAAMMASFKIQPTFAGSGNITVSGAATTSYQPRFLYSGGGNVVLTGAASTIMSLLYSGSGNVTLAGAATTSYSPHFIYGGGGNVVLAGAATTSYFPVFLANGSGNVTLAGSASTLMALSYSGSGNVTLAGSATTSYFPIFAASGSGNVTLAGAATTGYTNNFAYSGSGSVSLTGSASTKVAFPYAGSGSVTLAGAATTSYFPVFVYSGSGNISLSGAATTLPQFSWVGSGSVSLLGSATTTIQLVYSGGGNITINGAATTSFNAGNAYVGSGNITIAGAAVTSMVLSYVGSGNVVLAGAASTLLQFVYAGSGVVSLSGAASTSYSPHFVYAGSGSIVVQGAASSTVTFPYHGSGSVLLTGAATSTYTNNYIYVGSGTIVVSGAAVSTVAMSYIGSGVITITGHGVSSVAGVVVSGYLISSITCIPVYSVESITVTPAYTVDSIACVPVYSIDSITAIPVYSIDSVGCIPLYTITTIENLEV